MLSAGRAGDRCEGARPDDQDARPDRAGAGVPGLDPMMAPADRLRPLAPGDAPALAALHAVSFERGWSEGDFAILMAAGAWGFAATGAAGIEGFVLVQGEQDPEIITVAVGPDRRRRGLGRALVVTAADAAWRAGAARLVLEVAIDNVGAEALYLSLGFAPVGLRRGYYERAHGRLDARVLAARLPIAGAGETSQGLDRI